MLLSTAAIKAGVFDRPVSRARPKSMRSWIKLVSACAIYLSAQQITALADEPVSPFVSSVSDECFAALDGYPHVPMGFHGQCNGNQCSTTKWVCLTVF